MAEDDAGMLAEGWRRVPTVRYSAALGPIWIRAAGEGGVEVALDAQEHLANDNLGIVHGGAIMTFADIALGCGVGHALRNGGEVHDLEGSLFVTVQLQVQFVAAGSVGGLIIARPEVVRKTRSMVFMRGLILSGDTTVASADGIFKLLQTGRADAIRTR